MIDEEREKIFEVFRTYLKDLQPKSEKKSKIGWVLIIKMIFFPILYAFLLLGLLFIIELLKFYPKTANFVALSIPFLVGFIICKFLKKKNMKNFVDYCLVKDSKRFIQTKLSNKLLGFKSNKLEEAVNTLELRLKEWNYIITLMGVLFAIGFPSVSYSFFVIGLKPLVFSPYLLSSLITIYCFIIMLIILWSYQLNIQYNFFIKTTRNVIANLNLQNKKGD